MCNNNVTIVFLDIQFKREISDDIAKIVACQTVRQVLQGLEGAVITSIPGTSGQPPEPSDDKLGICNPSEYIMQYIYTI